MNNFSPLDFDLEDQNDFFSNSFGNNSSSNRTINNQRSSPSNLRIQNPLNALANLGGKLNLFFVYFLLKINEIYSQFMNHLLDQRLETEDPTPDIWEMFRDFDVRFFNGILVNRGVEVDWSSKMTLCAGLCRFSPGTSQCSIKLSKPLLQLRQRKDLVETLIHEMIHALLFVLRESDNRESHGPKFHENMFRINREAQLNISVYHTFHDEVRHFKTHVWRCKGVCRNRPPFYGWVKRSMNRKPGPYDNWWKQHQQTCGGEFEKLSEPEGFQDKKLKKNENIDKSKFRDIRDFFSPTKSIDNATNDSTNNVLNDNRSIATSSKIVGFDDLIKKEPKDDYGIPKSIKPFQGVGNVLGSSNINNLQPGRSILLSKLGNANGQNSSESINSFKKPINSTITNSSSNHLTNLNHNNPSFNKSISLDDRSEETKDSIKKPISHSGDSLNNSDAKRPKIEELITISDDEIDEEDFEWLRNISDEDLLRISQSSPIVID